MTEHSRDALELRNRIESTLATLRKMLLYQPIQAADQLDVTTLERVADKLADEQDERAMQSDVRYGGCK